MVAWLEAHQSLSGWAQFFGAMLALLVTYLTAFTPIWRRKRQLRNSAVRLLSHSYEVIESYHRTSAFSLPFPTSIRAAALTMSNVADDIGRFPIYELDDHGPRSIARSLVAMAQTLSTMALVLEGTAADLNTRAATEEDQATLREFLAERLAFTEALLSGKELTRPEPPPGSQNT